MRMHGCVCVALACLVKVWHVLQRDAVEEKRRGVYLYLMGQKLAKHLHIPEPHTISSISP